LEKAAELFEQACRLRPDDYQPACHLSSIYAGLGRKDDARAASSRCLEVVEKHLALHPEDARALYLGAVVWCQVGLAARGLDWAARALALDPEEPVTLYNVACVYALQGKIEPAIECLERAVQHGFAHKEWIEHDADLNALHAHPRYQALLSKLSRD
jgi:Flp pilus assembly protein TadD